MAAYNTFTLAEFIANVRTNLGPDAFWTDSEITQFINAGLRTWNCLTGFWSDQQTIALVGNHPYYTLASTLVFGARVELDGVMLDPGTLFGWDQQDPHWMSYRGVPQQWAPVGLAIIAVNPIPPSAGSNLTVFGIARAPILTAGTQKINLGQEDFNALSNYISHTLQVKSGGAELTSSMEAYKQFIEAAGVRNEKLRASTMYRRIMGVEQDKLLKQMRSILRPMIEGATNQVGMR